MTGGRPRAEPGRGTWRRRAEDPITREDRLCAGGRGPSGSQRATGRLPGGVQGGGPSRRTRTGESKPGPCGGQCRPLPLVDNGRPIPEWRPWLIQAGLRIRLGRARLLPGIATCHNFFKGAAPLGEMLAFFSQPVFGRIAGAYDVAFDRTARKWSTGEPQLLCWGGPPRGNAGLFFPAHFWAHCGCV